MQDKLHEAIVNLTQGWVESNIRLGPNVHAPVDIEEVLAVERIALEDEDVKIELAKLQLPEGAAVLSDPWIYGSTYPNLGFVYQFYLLRYTRIRWH